MIIPFQASRTGFDDQVGRLVIDAPVDATGDGFWRCRFEFEGMNLSLESAGTSPLQAIQTALFMIRTILRIRFADWHFTDCSGRPFLSESESEGPLSPF